MRAYYIGAFCSDNSFLLSNSFLEPRISFPSDKLVSPDSSSARVFSRIIPRSVRATNFPGAGSTRRIGETRNEKRGSIQSLFYLTAANPRQIQRILLYCTSPCSQTLTMDNSPTPSSPHSPETNTPSQKKATSRACDRCRRRKAKVRHPQHRRNTQLTIKSV